MAHEIVNQSSAEDGQLSQAEKRLRRAFRAPDYPGNESGTGRQYDASVGDGQVVITDLRLGKQHTLQYDEAGRIISAQTIDINGNAEVQSGNGNGAGRSKNRGHWREWPIFQIIKKGQRNRNQHDNGDGNGNGRLQRAGSHTPVALNGAHERPLASGRTTHRPGQGRLG